MTAFLSKFLLYGLLVSHVDAYRIPVGSIAAFSYQGVNVCTAFSVNEQLGYWATASHCFRSQDDAPELSIQGYPVDLVMDNPIADVAVFRGLRTTGLKVSNDQPYAWTPVFKYGYGNGWPVAWNSSGRFTDTVLMNPLLGHPVILFDLDLKPGDSGGPIMLYDNTVVSMSELIFNGERTKQFNERGIKNPSGGPDTETLYEVLSPYLPK